MAGKYYHSQPDTWETRNHYGGADGYGGNGGRRSTVTFAPPPQTYVTTRETVVEKVQTRPVIIDYNPDPPPPVETVRDANPLRRLLKPPPQHLSYGQPRLQSQQPGAEEASQDVRSRPMATTPTGYWKQQGRPHSPEDQRRHDPAPYGNGHRNRHDGYVAGNDNYPDRYHRPPEVEWIRLPATSDFQSARPTHGTPLTSATNDINTAVQQLKDSAKPMHAANTGTGTGTYGFVEHKPKPRFKVSVPYIPRNERAHTDREAANPNVPPRTIESTREVSGGYGGRLPPSRLLSTVDYYSPNTIDSREAVRRYNGAVVD